MKKLKDILKETKVWERSFGEALPTLDSATKAHAQNKVEETLNENSYDIKEVYYALGDALVGFDDMIKNDSRFKGHKDVFKFSKIFNKTFDALKKHLDRKHPDWD
jgi:hypothetical protein